MRLVQCIETIWRFHANSLQCFTLHWVSLYSQPPFTLLPLVSSPTFTPLLAGLSFDIDHGGTIGIGSRLPRAEDGSSNKGLLPVSVNIRVGVSCVLWHHTYAAGVPNTQSLSSSATCCCPGCCSAEEISCPRKWKCRRELALILKQDALWYIHHAGERSGCWKVFILHFLILLSPKYSLSSVPHMKFYTQCSVIPFLDHSSSAVSSCLLHQSRAQA